MTDKNILKNGRSYIFYGGVFILVGVSAFLFGHFLIAGIDAARDIIVTDFSILAGFLIAIMTLLGDHSLLPGGWRVAEKNRSIIKVKLVRQKYLFYQYLLTLIVIFISTLTKNEWPEITSCLERIYFGLATTAFLL